MNILETLLTTEERENAGAIASNRFSYQQVWAFNYIIERINQNVDFIVFMEFHDDILVLNRELTDHLELYQIKTDNKASRYITPAFITKNAEQYPEKMSIAQKLIINYAKFKLDVRDIHLVSNKRFNFNKLNNEVDSTTRNRIILNELTPTYLEKIKNGMCSACPDAECCTNKCLELVYFDVSDLGLDGYEDTVLGKLLKKLDEMKIDSSISKTKSLFNSILSEIRRINNNEKTSQNISELMKTKSISRKDVLNLICDLNYETFTEKWSRIQPLLISSGFTPYELTSIHKQWKKLNIDLLNVSEYTLFEILEKVKSMIPKTEITDYKRLIKKIYLEISKMEIISLYSEYYIYAIAIKELFDE
ncbi:dsDNA nuclease domain-containing protein [[Eubacterium] hominis]|uniref:dsDNA nuclease domain-containing protein n=1 Tax=[Eubacterium] hominis TaxID=2764325 RepID=UPI003A4D4C9E